MTTRQQEANTPLPQEHVEQLREELQTHQEKLQQSRRELSALGDRAHALQGMVSQLENELAELRDHDEPASEHVRVRLNNFEKRSSYIESRIEYEKARLEAEKVQGAVEGGLNKLKEAVGKMRTSKKKERYQWIIKAIDHGISKWDNKGNLTIKDSNGNSQKEGLPVDGLINALQELQKTQGKEVENLNELIQQNKLLDHYRSEKQKGNISTEFDFGKDKKYTSDKDAAHAWVESQSKELETLGQYITTLNKNSKKYFEAHPDMQGDKQHWRTKLEAQHIAADHRSTGNVDSDYQLAMDEMNNRRELIFSDVPPEPEEPELTVLPEETLEEEQEEEITPPETESEEESDDDESDDEEETIVEPEEDPGDEEDPEVEPDVPPEVEPVVEKPKEIVDIPDDLMKEMIEKNTGFAIREAVLSLLEGRGEHAKESFKDMLATIPEETKQRLTQVLDQHGYTFEEFETLWRDQLADTAFDSLTQRISQEVKNRVQDKVTVMDKLKAGWKSIAKTTALVAGGTAAIATGVGVLAGAIAALGAAIAGGGVLGRFMARKKAKRRAEFEESGLVEFDDYEAKMKMEEIIKKHKKEVQAELEQEIIAGGIENMFAGILSQTVREHTVSGTTENVNADVVIDQVLRKRIKEFQVEGKVEEAQALQAEQLLSGLQFKREDIMNRPEVAQADKKVRHALETVLKVKSGQIALDAEGYKNALAYAAPILIAIGVCSGGGAVVEAFRAASAGLGGGIIGARIGEHYDTVAQEKHIAREITQLMADMEASLAGHKQGTQVTGDREHLRAQLSQLEGQVQTGALDRKPLLKTRAEALIREVQRAVFDTETQREGLQVEQLGNLLSELQAHSEESRRQAEEHMQRILKKKPGWRKYVYGAGGALAGIAMVFGIEMARTGESDLINEMFGDKDVPTHTPDVLPDDGGQQVEEPVAREPEPTTSEPETVETIEARKETPIYSHTIEKGGSFLRGAQHLDDNLTPENIDAIRGKHPEWDRLSDDRMLAQWRVEQARANEQWFTKEAEYANVRIHPGAEMILITGDDGYPRIELGDKHVDQLDHTLVKPRMVEPMGEPLPQPLTESNPANDLLRDTQHTVAEAQFRETLDNVVENDWQRPDDVSLRPEDVADRQPMRSVSAPYNKDGTVYFDSHNPEQVTERVVDMSEQPLQSEYPSYERAIDNVEEWQPHDKVIAKNYAMVLDWEDRLLGFKGEKFQELAQDADISYLDTPEAKMWLEQTKQEWIQDHNEARKILAQGIKEGKSIEDIQRNMADHVMGYERIPINERDLTLQKEPNFVEYKERVIKPLLKDTFKPVQDKLDMGILGDDK